MNRPPSVAACTHRKQGMTGTPAIECKRAGTATRFSARGTSFMIVGVSGPQPLQRGDPTQVGGYRLRGVLGRGGQGAVYLGRAPTGGDVAIKVLHGQHLTDPAARRRFLREAELVQRVAAFCTAQVLDVDIE